LEQLGSAIGDTVCNIGEARDTALTNLGTLAAPPCDVLGGGCRLPTGQEVANQLGRWGNATGGAIGAVASDAGTALRPGCVPVLQDCRLDTPQEALRTGYGFLVGVYGGLDTLTFGAESNLGQWAGLDNTQIHCMPEYQQGARLTQAATLALGVYGGVRGLAGLAQGLRGAAGDVAATAGDATGAGEGSGLPAPETDPSRPPDPIHCEGCFAAGTQVATTHGFQAIETLRVGDVVLSENPVSGTVEAEPVQAVIADPASPLVAVDLSDGSTITTTATHDFWVDAGVGLPHPEWQYAEHLRRGDRLRTADGQAAYVARVRMGVGTRSSSQ